MSMTYHCPSCGSALDGQVRTFEVRQRIALHRQAHQRAERRRAQYRESKRRQRAREAEQRGIVGWLHNLACSGQHTRGRAGCVPIPCYAEPQS